MQYCHFEIDVNVKMFVGNEEVQGFQTQMGALDVGLQIQAIESAMDNWQKYAEKLRAEKDDDDDFMAEQVEGLANMYSSGMLPLLRMQTWMNEMRAKHEQEQKEAREG